MKVTIAKSYLLIVLIVFFSIFSLGKEIPDDEYQLLISFECDGVIKNETIQTNSTQYYKKICVEINPDALKKTLSNETTVRDTTSTFDPTGPLLAVLAIFSTIIPLCFSIFAICGICLIGVLIVGASVALCGGIVFLAIKIIQKLTKKQKNTFFNVYEKKNKGYNIGSILVDIDNEVVNYEDLDEEEFDEEFDDDEELSDGGDEKIEEGQKLKKDENNDENFEFEDDIVGVLDEEQVKLVNKKDMKQEDDLEFDDEDENFEFEEKEEEAEENFEFEEDEAEQFDQDDVIKNEEDENLEFEDDKEDMYQEEMEHETKEEYKIEFEDGGDFFQEDKEKIEEEEDDEKLEFEED